MRQVFSLETEREKDLQTLGMAVASCEFRKRRKICRAGECPSCRTGQELRTCMEQLPSCDSLRVEQLAMESYAMLEYRHGPAKPSLGRRALHAGALAAQGVGLAAVYIAGVVGFFALMFAIVLYVI